MKYFLAVTISLLSFSIFAKHMDVYDQSRNRHIPISVSYPKNDKVCSEQNKCNVAFISAGNRVPYEKYSFITEPLNNLNYLVVAIDHELPSDPPLSKTGDLYKTRIENWERGAETLDFVHTSLAKSKQFSHYDFDHLILIGHSNGGDISTWLTKENKSYIAQLITFDHKRVTLPKVKGLKVLSIRSPQYPTKEGVLLTKNDQKEFGICIIEIPGSKHMDLTDYGREEVKQEVADIVEGFLLDTETCDKLTTIVK